VSGELSGTANSSAIAKRIIVRMGFMVIS